MFQKAIVPPVLKKLSEDPIPRAEMASELYRKPSDWKNRIPALLMVL